ncbi:MULTISPECIES: manganese efflux pump MntP [Tatumella]|uniref:Putative manganese efflux pump MntP n=1 Tax=Tatumella punctata TaxID=399969 RepID=A0ABW1VM63_9GAMM|nr:MULTISPECIES: manganese efflux pump MntP [unclassified Tatumella]MBS0877595.1 manganese efflux pump MntP [Tatumella sp. JGM82]MBS0891052.1 manganese efflux pump MntP [Tatumella sp. JGM94]MBS0894495.1 manganese efflux pump MntP [Tatumella sp. JGM130]MBS0902127.1 manganese efflux pump MntP [Tatumella sp. JGM100]
MDVITTIILAFGMSMDAFAAALGKGAALKRPGMKEALRTGAIFGGIEMLTPLIGWGIGLAASQYVMAWDHWIAFLLLTILGGRMVMGGFRHGAAEECVAPERHGFMVLAMTAVATSLDALAVGVGLAFLQVNIVITAVAIGAATTIMATTGVLVGRFIGPILGKWAEVLGGVVLIGIGCTILTEHLGIFS